MSKYIVKKGDGWYRIAKNLGVNVNDLLKANNATLDTMIHPGLKLQIGKTKLVKKNNTSLTWNDPNSKINLNRVAVLEWVNTRMLPILEWSKLADKELNSIKTKLIKRNNKIANLALRKDKIRSARDQRIIKKVGSDNYWKNKALLELLHRAGFLKGNYDDVVDGDFGKNSNKALQAAEDAGWLVINGKLLTPKSQNQSLATTNQFTTIDTGEEYRARSLGEMQMNELQQKRENLSQLDYPNYLYKIGSDHKASNSFNTVSNMLRGLIGIKSADTNTSTGVKLQALALALKFRPNDADERLKSGQSVHWYLGKDSGGDYLWKYINGGELVHGSKDNIVSRTANRPAEHILGQYGITEHPDGSYTITDEYNFNEGGTKWAKNKIDSGEADVYDHIRYRVGQIMKNGSYPIKYTISSEEAKNWRKGYDNLRK